MILMIINNKMNLKKIYLMILINKIKIIKIKMHLQILIMSLLKNKIKLNKNKICISKNNPIQMMIFYSK